jgi:hypothetical protein
VDRRLTHIGTLALTLVVVATLASEASARTIRFSGRTWDVKDSVGMVGPGPNHFSDGPQTVWVDDRGRLHMRLERRHGHWQCAEIVSRAEMGYGTYTWEVVGRAATLDRNVVLGLFTWDDAPGDHHREIDIEWARWGRARGTDASFTVQPYTHDGNGHAFRMKRSDGLRTTQSFTWMPDRVRFASLSGHVDPPGSPADVIERWGYDGPDVPAEGAAHARINLWLFRGAAPSDGEPAELIVRSFTFEPAVARVAVEEAA